MKAIPNKVFEWFTHTEEDPVKRHKQKALGNLYVAIAIAIFGLLIIGARNLACTHLGVGCW